MLWQLQSRLISLLIDIGLQAAQVNMQHQWRRDDTEAPAGRSEPPYALVLHSYYHALPSMADAAQPGTLDSDASENI